MFLGILKVCFEFIEFADRSPSRFSVCPQVDQDDTSKFMMIQGKNQNGLVEKQLNAIT